MMFCPKCGQKLSDLETVCPYCGADVTEMLPPAEAEVPAQAPEAAEEALAATETVEAAEVPETAEAPEAAAAADEVEAGEPAEATEETQEESASAIIPEGKQMNEKMRSRLFFIGIVAALLILVSCAAAAYNHVYRGKTVDNSAAAVTVSDADGTVIGEISNQQLSFYFWGEYYYYVNSYGFAFDASLPLDEQPYTQSTGSEAEETAIATWEDYFMDCAMNSYQQTALLKNEAEKAGFTMPEDYQAEYDAVVENMPTNALSAGFAAEDGTGDTLSYIQDSYGPGATLEDFEEYLYNSYYVSAYSDSVYKSFTYDDQQLNAYYDENVDYFTSYGITKSETPNINVRHILIEPEESESGEITDAAKEDAKAKALDLLSTWKSGEATEESFAALANENSADGGSNTNGGLYEDVYPGQMVTTFNDWCFDSSRKPGDTDIVETDFGYHIMYFVSTTDTYYWKTVVTQQKQYADYQTWLDDLVEQSSAELSKKAAVAEPDAVKQIREKAAAEAAESEAAGSEAAG